MATLETVLKLAVPTAAAVCLIIQAFQHFRKKWKSSEQTDADKNSKDRNSDSSISNVANKSEVEVEEEEASAVSKGDGENVVKTDTEDRVDTKVANRNEMVQNTGDKHQTNTSSGDGGSMLGCGDVHISKTGTDHAKQAEMVQKSADGKHRANPDNSSMGYLHSDKIEVPINSGECSDDSQLVKSTCTSLSDSLYLATELDLESVGQDDIDTASRAQLDSDSGCVSMESVPRVTMVPTGNGAGTSTSIRAVSDQQGTSRHTGFGRGAIPKGTTDEVTSKGLETQYSVVSTDGGERDYNERLDSLWQSQGLNEPEHSTNKQLPLISEASHPSSSQPILDLSQSLHVNQRHFHQSSSSPTIYKGGDSSLTIFGGCNTIGHVSFNLPSASAPDLGQGTFVSRSDSGFEGDFVTFYCDKDAQVAETFKKHLEEDIPDIKAELFPYIDENKSLYESLETVLNRFIYVLVIMSPNFKSDAKSRRAGEDLLSDSFEGEHKRNRIVPVWMSSEKKDCPMEFKSLQGIRYYERSDEVLGRLYREGLRKQVDKMRKEAHKKRRELKSQASLP